ncbi:MAG: FAD-linked oxidase C-terminal domain-containing protein [Solirubrobacteraceae bacterium]
MTRHTRSIVGSGLAPAAVEYADAVEGVAAIGARRGLRACSLGHAGDGNVHGCFLLVPGDQEASMTQQDLAIVGGEVIVGGPSIRMVPLSGTHLLHPPYAPTAPAWPSPHAADHANFGC